MAMYSFAPGWCSTVWGTACALIRPPRSACAGSHRNQIDDGEDDDPDDVNEVPVKPGDLDVETSRLRDLPLGCEDEERQQPGNPQRDVRAMKAGQHDERRAAGTGGGVEPFGAEAGELVDLPADEDQAEPSHRQEPDLQSSHVAALDSCERQHHGETTHEKGKGAHRRVGNIEDVLGVRVPDPFTSVDEESDDEG